MQNQQEQTYRGGLIGCGYFATIHLKAWRSTCGADIVAVCDLDEQRARQAANEFQIANYYHDVDEMISREHLDFVDIVTRDSAHRVLVEKVANRGLPVICQKPLSRNFDDAEAMVRACQDAKVPFMVHENFRWQAPIRAVKRILDENRIGKPFFARVSFRSGRDIYANQPYLAELPKFILLDLGIHILDVARFLLGEASSLTCRTNSVNPRVRGEDVATIMLGHPTGATSIVDISYASHLHPDPFPQTLLHVEGPQGTIDLDRNYQIRITQGDQVETVHAPPESLDWLTPPAEANQEAVLRIQQHWVDCLRANRQPETCGTDNLKTLQLVFAAYESAKQGQTIVMSNEGKLAPVRGHASHHLVNDV